MTHWLNLNVRLFSLLLVVLLTVTIIPISAEGAAISYAPSYTLVDESDDFLNITAYPEWNIGGGLIQNIDVSSNGTMFLRTTIALYRSYNGGANWTVCLNSIGNGDSIVLANDTIISTSKLTSTTKVYISYDLGDTWIQPLTTATNLIWNVGISRAPNGDLFIGEYSSTQKGMSVHRSHDGGLTWAATNMSALIGDYTNYSHVHAVYAPSSDAVYASMGDGRQLPVRSIWKSSDRGVSWSKLTNFDAPTSMIQIGTKFYAGTDTGGGVFATTDWTNWEQLLWGDKIRSDGLGWGTGFEYDSTNDILYYATSSGASNLPGQVLFSPDKGVTWGLLYDGVSMADITISFVHNKLFWTTRAGNSFSNDLLTQATAWHLIGDHRHRTGIGEIYDVVDGEMAYLSFASAPVKNIRIKVSSRSVNNTILNPSFEENYNWNYPGFPMRSSEQALFGNYSAKVTNGTKSCENYLTPGTKQYISPSTTYTMSGWVKNIGGVKDVTSPGAMISVKTYTAAGAYVGVHYIANMQAMNVQDWVYISGTFTTAATAERMIVTCGAPNHAEKPGIAWYFDGLMMTAGTEILPFSEGGVSENITLNINGVNYTAEDGDIITIPGITTELDILPSIDGSRVATIEVIGGTDVMESNGMLFNYVGGSLTITHNKYATDTILWSSTAKLDISAFTGTAHTMYMNCSVPIIMQFEPYTEHLSWITNWTGYATQEYILTGFEANKTYQLDVDGTYNQSIKADESGVLTFTYEGTGSTHIFEVTEYWLDSSMNNMMFIIVPVMIVMVLIGSVTTMFGKFKH